MVNIRVQRFSGEPQICESELDVVECGWAVVEQTGSKEAPREVFRDGEFVGDVVELDTTPVDDGPFTELVYAPVPSED